VLSGPGLDLRLPHAAVFRAPVHDLHITAVTESPVWFPGGVES
jgi:hypothetical protein